MDKEAFLNISEASRLLGVSEAALRQWTDEGKIKAFITPGGHRRYSKAELKKLTNSHSKMLGIRDLVSELEETNGQLRKIGHESLKSSAWYGELNDKEKKHLADMGRRILNLIIKYITEPSHREETMQLVREAGRDFGETLSGLNLPLTDSIEIFIQNRDPMMNAVTHLIRKKETFTGRVVEAIPMVTHVMDEALVALVAAHRQHQNGIYSKGDETE